MNCSTLKFLADGAPPAKALWKMQHPEADEDTDALAVGDATHVAVLEPERFARQYVKRPKFDGRTNAGKAAMAGWAAEHPNAAPLTPDQWDEAVGLRDNSQKHPVARELLSGKGRNEVTLIWTDPETKLLCKGRLDRITRYDNRAAVVDLKTARNGSLRGFAKAAADFCYFWQAAFYLDALNLLAPGARRFFHIILEKEPPYLVAVREMEEPSLREGRAQYRRALNTMAACRASGKWPGYFDGIEPFDIPKHCFELVDPNS
jgi:exodeoxyribonuclease VIII